MELNTLDRDKAYIWHPFTPLKGMDDNMVVTHGEGACLFTEDGKTIIDAISSWWVNLHGHGNPHIAKAIAEQAQRLEHVMFAGFTHEPAVKLAENLLSVLPNNQQKVFFSDNGSTAVEVGLKMALQYWHNQGVEKKKIIALEGGYHGDTFGGMSLGERGAFTTPFWPYLFEVEFVPIPQGEDKKKAIIQFEALVDEGSVAAFIFEPIIQGASGMRIYEIACLDHMIEYAQSRGVICVADEVMTGFGRTGSMFAADFLEHKPDIMCLSKGLTGGAMGMGATSCTESIQEAYQHSDIMKTFFHGHSFTGNPIACAAANASFDLLVTPQCKRNIQRIDKRLAHYKMHLAQNSLIKEVRHMGTILALELASNQDTSYVNEARHRLYPFFMERGVLLRPLGNILYIIPPYVITNEQLDLVFNAIAELLEEANWLA